MIDNDKRFAAVPYGVYTMRLIGPPAMIDRVGPWEEFDVEGTSVSCMEYDATEMLCRAMGREYDSLPDECCPFEFADPKLTANKYRNPDGTQQWFVGVYAITRQFGGHEEGGWCFDTGELVQQTAVASHEDAEQLRDELRQEFPQSGKRQSVLGGDDYDICIGVSPHAEFFPEERPRYE